MGTSTHEEDSRVPRAADTSTSTNTNTTGATNASKIFDSADDDLGVSFAQVRLAGDRKTLLPSLWHPP